MTTAVAPTAVSDTPTRSPALDRRRRRLQVALGVLWLLDAALQFQPYMFTRAFPAEVIAPTASGNPAWVAGPVGWTADLLSAHVVVLNAVFATAQLAIAAGLLYRRTVKLALAGSVVWSLLVWWLGEGLGGILAGPVSPLAGLPGAVVLYALIAVLVWPTGRTGYSVAWSSPFRAWGSTAVWIGLWLAFAAETMRPANLSPRGTSSMIRGMADGEPGWLAGLDRQVASLAAGHGLAVAVTLAALCLLIAVSVLDPATIGVGLVLAAVVAGLIWVVAQNFGEIATGTGTDPNTGLPLVLLAACYAPVRFRKPAPRP